MIGKTAPKAWDPDQDDQLVCQAVFDESADIRTFVFTAREPRRFHYEPGQFINVEVKIGDEVHVRSYTLSSSPARPERVAISVKRLPAGLVSRYLHDHLRPGDVLKVSGPLGGFSKTHFPAKKYLFLSAGIGITPLLSMARAAHDRAESDDIVFFHCTRHPADIPFHDEIALMAQRSPSIRPIYAVSTAGEEPGLGRFRGRLTAATLKLACPDFSDREILCCGPDGYMAEVRAMLQASGFGLEHYHEESFSFSEPAAPADEAQAAQAEFQISFSKTGRVISCGSDTFILAAARKAGIPLPSSCGKGLCGTCKSKKLAGQVEMKHQGGIRQREIDSGLVLLCSAKPLSDVIIDR